MKMYYVNKSEMFKIVTKLKINFIQFQNGGFFLKT